MTPYQNRIYKDPQKAVGWAIKHKQRFPEAEPYILKAAAEPYILKATDPGTAYSYAKAVLKGRWPEAEEAIAKNPIWAYHYAKDVLKRRWPEAESVIATDPKWAYEYAKHVIQGRWPEAEPVIATSPYSFGQGVGSHYFAYKYAKDVIGGRWPEAEAVIAKSPGHAEEYLSTFPDAKLSWAMKGWLDWEQAWL